MNAALPQLLFIGAIVAAFWFLILRPQQQQRKKHDEMVSALEPGVRIMTIGGFFGRVVEVEGDNVLVEIAEGVKVEMIRGAIAKIVTDEELAEAVALNEAEYADHSDHDDPPVGDAEDDEQADSKAKA